MKIENIQLFYLSMPEILDEADGSQDALIVKVEGGGLEGWGECEASPLTSIANFICPKSHSAANPIRDSILGKNLNNLEDIKNIIKKYKIKNVKLIVTMYLGGYPENVYEFYKLKKKSEFANIKIENNEICPVFNFNSLEPKLDFCHKKPFGIKNIFEIDRKLLSILGLPQYGIHGNAWSVKKNRVIFHFAKRSPNLDDFPGYYDNLFAGGQPTRS